jgi:hypothetical protein
MQTVIISRMQKLSKEGLQRTDKRIGLMNEILAAMDTVKYVFYRKWSTVSLYNNIFSYKTCLVLTFFVDYVDMAYRCYAWESSFQSRVENVRNDELSWFRKASLLGAVWNHTNSRHLCSNHYYLFCCQFIFASLNRQVLVTLKKPISILHGYASIRIQLLLGCTPVDYVQIVGFREKRELK